VTADLIVENAKVLTIDPARPRAEAVAVRGNRILAVGDRAAMAELRGPATRVIDAAGTTLLPGFIEAHMHVFPGGAGLASLQLATVHGLDALTAAVRRWAAEHPDDPIVYGVQASYQLVGEPLTRHVLDRVLPDRPLGVHAFDGHTVWGNTMALERAGLLHGRDLPPGNEIVMAPDGRATGELREPAAYAPLMALLPSGGREKLGITTGRDPDPPPAPDQRAMDSATIRRGLEWCARHGITSFHNMDGNPYQLDLLAELDDAGELACRVRLPFHMKNDMVLAELRETAPAMRARGRPDRLTSDFVKIFVDGVLDSTTAFMLDDYEGQPGNRGLPLFSQEQIDAAVVEADRLGFQVAVHSIGDAGVRRTLDAYAAARRTNGPRDSRHRVEHIEVIDPADVPRFKELGVVASMQPLHAPGPISYPGHEMMALLGERREPWTFAWRTLRDAGARLAFASDWPVSPIDPLLSIQAALVRKPWRPGQPEQAQTLDEALAGYTSDNAWVEFAEDRKGMLKEGYLADLVLLDGDIEAVPANAIRELKVRLTVCDGKVTHEAG
jgi:predicted amidohydrolase YtcJ